MPVLTELTYAGNWRITIQSRNAGWDQRVAIENSAAGNQTFSGNVGLTFEVKGNNRQPWKLRIQHNDGQSGWQDSWLSQGIEQVQGSCIVQVVKSEDITSSSSDLDYDDLVVRLEKIGMIDQPSKPFAVYPATVQMMPDGIFEAGLGRYFMAVRVCNVWTKTWPVNAVVGLTSRCRQWLLTEGIVVTDAWSSEDQAVVNQEVVNGRVRVGALKAWESRLVYFKVDVSGASVGKHNIEVEVLEPGAVDPDHKNRKAVSQIFVSRTIYDGVKKVFVSECDRGTLTAAIRELVVDYNTFKKAMGKSREIFRSEEGSGTERSASSVQRRCSRAEMELIRRDLRDFLEGKSVDLCAIWRRIQCCCADGFGGNPLDGENWTGKGGNGLEFFAFPTAIDYNIAYEKGFLGRYGPIPFDDPWWKVLLLIIAILLSLASSASAVSDLANRSDDVVIGQVKRSVFDVYKSELEIPAPTDANDPFGDPGSVDAAIVKLNGNRNLTTSIFSYLDAATGEANTSPISILNGFIDTSGKTLSNKDIKAIVDNFIADPSNPAVQDALRLYKSGARTGLTRALITSVVGHLPRKENGHTVYFRNQVYIKEDPANPCVISNSGDSGSLWLQYGSNAIVALNHAGSREDNSAYGTRIEDVMKALGIKFGD